MAITEKISTIFDFKKILRIISLKFNVKYFELHLMYKSFYKSKCIIILCLRVQKSFCFFSVHTPNEHDFKGTPSCTK